MLNRWIRSRSTPAGSRSLAWLLRLACVGILVLGSVLAAALAARADVPGWATLAGFTALLVASLMLAQAVLEGARSAGQHARDLRAAEIFDAVRTGRPAGPFILYLRPFASTDAIAAHRLRAIPVGRSGLVVHEDRLEIEGEIARALPRNAPLVALGQPLEHHGAGRIAVPDSQWQAAIEALMDAASLVLLLPSPREGTLWEVDRLIAGGHLGKTLILDPPNHGASRPDYDPAAEWQGVQTAFARRGYGLPDDHRTGLLLSYAPGERAPRREPLGLDAARTLGAIVRRRLAEPGRNGEK